MIRRDWRWIERSDLSDEEWALLEPLVPKNRESTSADDRRVMDAIFFVLRTDTPWQDLPKRYGPYLVAYNRFNRWSRRGIWQRIYDELAAKSRDHLYLLHLIDQTIVKARFATSGAKARRKTRRPASAVAAAPRRSTRSSTAKAAR